MDNIKTLSDYLKVAGTTKPAWFQKLNIENYAPKLAPKQKKPKSSRVFHHPCKSRYLSPRNSIARKFKTSFQTAANRKTCNSQINKFFPVIPHSDPDVTIVGEFNKNHETELLTSTNPNSRPQAKDSQVNPIQPNSTKFNQIHI